MAHKNHVSDDFKNIVPVILAGGKGARLYPLSRPSFPKPFLPVFSGRSFLQETVRRVENMQLPIIVCGEQHDHLVAKHMQAIGVKPGGVILEPAGRNTAPAVGAVSCLLQEEDPLLLVLPSDHKMERPEKFRQAVETAIPHARQGKLVLFGVEPDGPVDRFGYIQKGPELTQGKALTQREGLDQGKGQSCFAISRFIEKPPQAMAKYYLNRGGYLWNSGIFLFSACAFLQELSRYELSLYDGIERVCRRSRQSGDHMHLNGAAFHVLPSLSVDRAVMERTDKGVIVPMEAGWDDLGTWSALMTHMITQRKQSSGLAKAA